MTQNLFETVRAADRAAPFITTPEGRTISYANAIDLSGQIANALTKRGVVPGDRVAVQVEKSPEAILLYFACLRAGAVFLPLNTGYTLAELDYFIGDAEPRVVVCDPARKAALEETARARGVSAIETLGIKQDGSLLDLARTQPSAFEDVARAGYDLAAILYTSGTTGRSKGAMLSHENLASNARALQETWRYTSRDVLLHALPIFHTHGLFVATNLTMLCGASMIFLPKFDPDQIFALMARATVMMGVPTFYVRLLQDKRLSVEATRHMRLFIAGSAPLLAETHRAWTAATGHAILERYGMTETNMLTSNPYDGERIPGSVGLPLPGVALRIADPETGAALPEGDVGMIEVKGPNVFSGYWRMPEKTKAEFRPGGYFITGDLGKIGPGGYVSIVGRGKDLVISGGYNVYPKEVETEIDAIPGVIESAVFGAPHRDFGEGVTAAIVKHNGTPLTERDVMAALDGRLAKFKCPKAILFLDELPRNTMGKVLKNELRERYQDIYAQSKTQQG